MMNKPERLNQRQKNLLRRKANEALTVENYGEDGDNFHELATAQVVIGLLDEIDELKAKLKGKK